MSDQTEITILIWVRPNRRHSLGPNPTLRRRLPRPQPFRCVNRRWLREVPLPNVALLSIAGLSPGRRPPQGLQLIPDSEVSSLHQRTPYQMVAALG